MALCLGCMHEGKYNDADSCVAHSPILATSEVLDPEPAVEAAAETEEEVEG